MFGWLAEMLQAFFAQAEITPESVTEIEIIQSRAVPWSWWLHLQPARPWYVEVAYQQGEWSVVLYSYIVGE